MAGYAISKVVIGLGGTYYGVCWCIISFNHSNAPCSHGDLWGVSCPIYHRQLFCWTHWPAHSPAHSQSWPKQTYRFNACNVHEMSLTNCSRAWMHPKVVYHRAWETGNRIRAGVGWWQTPTALTQSFITVYKLVEGQSEAAAERRFTPIFFQFLLFLSI